MLPNCLVIGAPRSGTTSVYEYLNAHPDVYMSPVKEPDFFSRTTLDAVHRPDSGSGRTPEENDRCRAALQADLDQYLALFAGASDEKIRGEASAIYLGHPTAAEHIRRYVPDVKLIAILRDPAERIYSHYLHAKRIQAEYSRTAPDGGAGERSLDEKFAEVVECAYRHGFSGPAITDPEVWVRSGFYFRHLTRFRSLFPEQQLRVFLFEDLVRDARGLMADIFGFLEVDELFVLPTTEAFNATVVPRSRGLFRFFTTRNSVMRFARSVSPPLVRAVVMRTRNRVLASSKPELQAELRHKLVSIYREDINQLQGLLSRDLSAWLDEENGR
jgi:hypothetical protein